MTYLLLEQENTLLHLFIGQCTGESTERRLEIAHVFLSLLDLLFQRDDLRIQFFQFLSRGTIQEVLFHMSPPPVRHSNLMVLPDEPQTLAACRTSCK